MGEMAEMMLDGTMCQYCGEYLGSDNGYPTSCGCDEQTDIPVKVFIKPSFIKKTCTNIVKQINTYGSMDAAIEQQLRTQLEGILSKFYADDKRIIHHDGIEKTLATNKKAKKRK